MITIKGSEILIDGVTAGSRIDAIANYPALAEAIQEAVDAVMPEPSE